MIKGSSVLLSPHIYIYIYIYIYIFMCVPIERMKYMKTFHIKYVRLKLTKYDLNIFINNIIYIKKIIQHVVMAFDCKF